MNEFTVVSYELYDGWVEETLAGIGCAEDVGEIKLKDSETGEIHVHAIWYDEDGNHYFCVGTGEDDGYGDEELDDLLLEDCTDYINPLRDKKKFVNVYAVTRRFGGHEEGGWYYDHYQLLESVEIEQGSAEYEERKNLCEKYETEQWGDISSVQGGQKIKVYVEWSEASSETKEAPRYE